MSIISRILGNALKTHTSTSVCLNCPPDSLHTFPTFFLIVIVPIVQVDLFFCTICLNITNHKYELNIFISGQRTQSPGRVRPPSPVMVSRVQEKDELAGLNDRLAAYIDRMRFLENENRQLSTQIQSHEETVTREVTNIKVSAYCQMPQQQLHGYTFL